MTGELDKDEICDCCPIENPRIGHCWNCNNFHNMRENNLKGLIGVKK